MKLIINERDKVRTVEFWDSFNLNLKYDSVASTFAFKFYFDPTNIDHQEMAELTHYHEAIMEHNGERLLTGYILSQTFNKNVKTELAQLGGYSKPGVLEDCDIPTDIPKEFNGLSLKEVTERILARFKLKLVVQSVAKSDSAVPLVEKLDGKIKSDNTKVSQNIKSYLTELAKQRNVILSHDAYGNLVFTEPKTFLKPLLHFEDGVIGTSMALSFSGQQIHSHITVISQSDINGGNVTEETITNPYCPIVYRPKVIEQSSGDDISAKQCAMNALAAELKNIVLTITTDRWEIDGKIIKPNNIVTVTAPELFLYHNTRWFIESIDFTGDAKKTTAVLTCVLPEVYNGKTPTNIFKKP